MNEIDFAEMHVRLNLVLFLMVSALSIKQDGDSIHRPSSPPHVDCIYGLTKSPLRASDFAVNLPCFEVSTITFVVKMEKG